MNIILTDLSGANIFLLPIVPSNVKITSGSNNQTLDGISGEMRIIGNRKLRTAEWTSFFPVDKDYKFVPAICPKNGWLYVAFIELMRKLKLPLRMIFTTKNKIPILNILVSIDKFVYETDQTGDINYTLNLTEFAENLMNFIDTEREAWKKIPEYKEHVGNYFQEKIERFENIKAGLMKETRKNTLYRL